MQFNPILIHPLLSTIFFIIQSIPVFSIQSLSVGAWQRCQVWGGICVTLSKLLTSILSKIILNHKVVIKVRQNSVFENACTKSVDSTQYTLAPLPED